MDMDYIREFDIRLEKEMYYAGETLSGHVILDTIENFKLRAIRVVLRGKAHTEWKVVVSGDRRTVKDDQYFIDDRAIIWGKEKAEGTVPILPRGMHQFPFRFQLPESSLPCSFESRAGTIRYYIKVTVDIPYASPPQGMKYFTIIGPHIDCMDDQYLKPMIGQAKRTTCCFCCQKSPIVLKSQLERSAYVCGESLRVKAEIDNQTEEEARLKLKLVQYVEYYIDRGVLGVTKEVSHTILEYRGAPVAPHTRSKWDSAHSLVVSTMPATLLGVCRLMQIYYLLKVNVELEKSGEDLHMHFPITIATVPFRIPNSQQQPAIHYEVASDHVEGGMYIGPEFQLGQVYDGGLDTSESVVLYRPVYVCVQPSQPHSSSRQGGQVVNSSGGSSGTADGKPAGAATAKSPGPNKKSVVIINHEVKDGEASGSGTSKQDGKVKSPKSSQKLNNATVSSTSASITTSATVTTSTAGSSNTATSIAESSTSSKTTKSAASASTTAVASTSSASVSNAKLSSSSSSTVSAKKEVKATSSTASTSSAASSVGGVAGEKSAIKKQSKAAAPTPSTSATATDAAAAGSAQ